MREFKVVLYLSCCFPKKSEPLRLIYLIFMCVLFSACRYDALENSESQASSEIASSVEESNLEMASDSENPFENFPLLKPCDGKCSCEYAIEPLNDTGVVREADTIDGEMDGCNEFAVFRQDCQDGRDSENDLVKTGDGRGGFDFTKIDTNGERLSNDSEDWRCVVDNHTGLMWEVKLDGDSESYGNTNNTFSWFSLELLDYGTPENGSCNLQNGCDTQHYIDVVNQNRMCGFDDWRLPDRLELQSLADYGLAQPSIDRDYFPNTKNEFYWTSTIDTDDLKSIWQVDFNYGRVAGSLSSGGKHLRLVRDISEGRASEWEISAAEESFALREIVAPRQRCNGLANLTAPMERFRQDQDGNVFDSQTGLIWQRCIVGASGEYCEEGQPQMMSWGDALYHASEVVDGGANGGSAWRIPNIKELQSIIEMQCEEPALNPFIFPNMPLDHVWSSTPNPKQQDKSFYMQYQNSIVFYSSRNDLRMVHLVKDCNEGISL